jgi:hypothetical protein
MDSAAGHHTTALRIAPLVALVALVPLLLTSVPPIQDLPAHAALVQALCWEGPLTLYETAGPFTHSWLFYLMGAALQPLLGAYGATVALLGVSVVGLPLGVAALARRLGGDPLIALAAAGIAWNRAIVMGFLPFTLSVAAALYALAFVLDVQGARRALVVAAASVLTWYLHAFGFAAFAVGVVVLTWSGWTRPSRQDALCALGLLPGVALYLASGAGGGLSGFVYEPLGERVARLVLFAGPASVTLLPELAAAGVVVVAVAAHARGRAALPHPARRLLPLFGLFVLGTLSFPDFVESPRIALLTSRFLPFFAALLLASTPLAHRIARVVALSLAAVAIGASALVLQAEGQRLSEAAIRIAAVGPGGPVLGVTAHRPQADSLLRTYAALHLPFLVQARGTAEVLAPFSHPSMPVHLRPEALSVAELSYTDVVAYVGAGSAIAARVVSDGGDVAGFVEATGLDRLPPCGLHLPAPWLCRIAAGALRAGAP